MTTDAILSGTHALLDRVESVPSLDPSVDAVLGQLEALTTRAVAPYGGMTLRDLARALAHLWQAPDLPEPFATLAPQVLGTDASKAFTLTQHRLAASMPLDPATAAQQLHARVRELRQRPRRDAPPTSRKTGGPR